MTAQLPELMAGGLANRPERPWDHRLSVTTALLLCAAALSLAATTTITYYEVDYTRKSGETVSLGCLSLWRVDFNDTLLLETGTQPSSDFTAKHLISYHSGRNRRHREISDDLVGHEEMWCQKAPAVCDGLKDISHTFLKMQGLLLVTTSMVFAVLFVLPIKEMRTFNQSVVIALTEMITAGLMLSATGVSTWIPDAVEDAVLGTFMEGSVDVTLEAGIIIVYVATGLHTLAFLYSVGLCFAAWKDPYPLGDGPNFTEDNPMPVHFKPLDQRPAHEPFDQQPENEPQTTQ